jgi:hypothetical protein
MSRALLALAATVLLIAQLAGCDGGGSTDDDDGSGGVQPGTFTATVDGDFTASLSGRAVSTGFGGTWGIVLAPGESQTITLTTTGVGRVPPGTYAIRRNELDNPVQAGEFYGSIVLEAGSSWYVRTGTLTVTSSTSASVAGTFSFTADRFVGDGEEVSIEGAFSTTNTGG